MKVLVCLSRTPDTTANIVFDDTKKVLVEEGIQWIINPYDEWYALGKALDLKSEGKITSIDLLMVGTADVEPIMRKALALGGDQAIRIDYAVEDSLTTAKLIANYMEDNVYDIILGGKETIDYNGNSVMPMLAAALGQPFVEQIVSLEVQEDVLHFSQPFAGGIRKGKAPKGTIFSCQKGLSEQRIPNMRGIMAARTKPINIHKPDIHKVHVPITESLVLQEEENNIQWIEEQEATSILAILKDKHNIKF